MLSAALIPGCTHSILSSKKASCLQIVHLLIGMVLSSDAGLLERCSMKEGEGLAVCCAGYKESGYRDSGNSVSKSMYSPLKMHSFTFSGSSSCCLGCEAVNRPACAVAVASANSSTRSCGFVKFFQPTCCLE